MADLEALLASLQEENSKLDHEFKGACFEARSAQIKADEAESLIDDKRNVKDVAARAIEKDEQKKREMVLQEESDELMQENVKLRSTENRLISTIDDLVGRLRQYEPDEVPNPIQEEKKEEPNGDNKISTSDSFIPVQPSDNLSTVPNFTRGNPTTPTVKKEEPIDPQDLHEDSQHATNDSMGEEEPIEDEVLNDDVSLEMGDAGMGIEDSTSQPLKNDDFAPRTMQPSDLMGDDMILNEEVAEVREPVMAEMDSFEMVNMNNVEHGNGMDQSEISGNGQEDSISDDVIERENETEMAIDNVKDSSVEDGIVLKDNGRPSRRVSRAVKSTDSMEDSDGDETPQVKKSRSEPEKTGKKRTSSNKASAHSDLAMKNPKVAKMNDKELECPECEVRTKSVRSWQHHLRSIHSTNCRQAGLALRCDCGFEALSYKHFHKCEIANVTVIQIDDKMKASGYRAAKINDTELECPECEYRGRSVRGWVSHLREIHSTTPTLSGLALRCDCGHEGPSDKHSRTCDSTNWTIVIRKKQDTPQCIMCELYPSTMRAYCEHFQKTHKTTLKERGIYLKCACAFKITSKSSFQNHNKECNLRDFTLQKLTED